MSYDSQIEPTDDGSYYNRRAAEEASRAELAITAEAKQAHQALAAILAHRAAEISGQDETPPNARTVQHRSKLETLARAFDGADDLPLRCVATKSGDSVPSEIDYG